MQDSQSENPAQAAFTGGITLYADSHTAYVNSEPVEMPGRAVCGKRKFLYPAAIRRRDDGMVISGTERNRNACIVFAPDHAHGRNTDDSHRR